MIKGIFCHDLPIYKDKNGVYCSTTLTNDLFKRYLHIVDELVVSTRVYNMDKTYQELHQEPINLPQLSFLDLPNVNKPLAIFKDIPYAKNMINSAMKDCNVVIIRGGTVALIGARVARKLNKPYLIECGGHMRESLSGHSVLGKIVAPFMHACVKKDIKKASHVIYVTQKWLQDVYHTQGVGVGISDVYIKDLDTLTLKNRLNKIEEKNDNAPLVIGTTAGLTMHKGQQFVIKAMAKLKGKVNIRYELVGGGDDSYLRSLVKKHKLEKDVIFKGQLTHDEVLAWLDKIDIYVQPSLTEGLSRAVVEAMSRACPVISSDAGGIHELIDEKAIVKKGSVDVFVKAFLSITKKDCLIYAQQNFDKTKEFNAILLDKKREEFLEDYLRCVTIRENDL